MSKREIHLDSKKKKHLYVDMSIRNRGIVNGKIANDVKKRNPNWKYDIVSLTRGEKWFNDGFTLDDASIDDRNNVSFVAGFNKGKRIRLINERLFELGREYFDRGCSIDNVPNIYKDNEYFLNGYNYRLNNSRSR